MTIHPSPSRRRAGSTPASGKAVQLAGGKAFEQSKLYEFTYPAKDPLVVGLSFAAIRDVADFLRNAPTDRRGHRTHWPVDAQQIYTFCYSQPCRAMHDFVRLGFNQTAAGGRAVDGIESLVAGASGGFFNYRFAQPGRTMRQHIGRWYPERQFPFANQVTTDPVTGQTDGVLQQCSRQRHLPEDLRGQLRDRVLEQGRLAADDRHPGQRPRPRRDAERALLPPVEPSARGRDRHSGSANSRRTRCCPTRRSVRFWSRSTSGSPAAPRRRANRVPRRGDGTLVPALPQSGVGFPAIPGVTYNGRTTTGDLFDFGSRYSARAS